ncbi:Uncharacterised protein [Mycobacterium tuberculosis]|nr:Uncharacterised protein [Mycobacterium tuberculosis]
MVAGSGTLTAGGTSPLRVASAGIRITAARWPHSLVCTLTSSSPTKSPCGRGRSDSTFVVVSVCAIPLPARQGN